jgi:hypothetical protein
MPAWLSGEPSNKRQLAASRDRGPFIPDGFTLPIRIGVVPLNINSERLVSGKKYIEKSVRLMYSATLSAVATASMGAAAINVLPEPIFA